MFNQIRAEFYKLFHTKALYLTFALILAVFGIFSIGGQQQFVASSSSLDETWKIGETVGFLARAYSDTAHPLIEEIIRTATSYTVFFWLIVLIFSVIFFSREYTDSTIKIAIASGQSRIKFFVAKYIVISITSIFLYFSFIMIAFIIECAKFNIPIQLFPMLKIAGLNCMIMGAFIGITLMLCVIFKHTAIVVGAMSLFTFSGPLIYMMTWDNMSTQSWRVLTYLKINPMYYWMNTCSYNMINNLEINIFDLFRGNCNYYISCFSIDTKKARNTLIITERGNANMLYFLLICFIFILAFSLFSIIRTIRNINKQIKQQRKIRVSLSNRDIEELAYAINQKDNLHKKLQVQIKQEEEQLKQSISNISHDLRTPLTSIQGYLTLLQECEDKQEQGQCIKIIKAKTDYLTDLVQEFYDLSVIENEQVDVECERVDINRIVTDCLIEKYYEFGEIQPTIQTENTPVWIYGNNLICKRIIENLIVNALRYSDNYIEVSINQKGVFTIKNSTKSLDDIDVNLLFNKFYTVDKSRTKGSSGLGLYIVKELLKKIDGKIENVSYEKNILSISICFPLYNDKKLL